MYIYVQKRIIFLSNTSFNLFIRYSVSKNTCFFVTKIGKTFLTHFIFYFLNIFHLKDITKEKTTTTYIFIYFRTVRKFLQILVYVIYIIINRSTHHRSALKRQNILLLFNNIRDSFFRISISNSWEKTFQYPRCMQMDFRLSRYNILS